MPANLELIENAFRNVAEAGEIEMVASLAEGREDGIRGLIAPDAEIRFMALDDGALGGNDSAFLGPEGYLAGWLEWLQPYETFGTRLLRISEVGENQVLLEIEATAKLRGSGIETAAEAAAIYELRDGQIACADHYMSLAQARRAAGLA